MKMSVSEVKSIAAPESEYVPVIKPIGDASFRSADEIDSKSRGSITHYVIQHIDIHRTDTLEEIEKQLDEMIQNGIINSKQRSVVSSKSIYSFYGSGLGKRLKKAKRVENELSSTSGSRLKRYTRIWIRTRRCFFRGSPTASSSRRTA